jgi:hypothetical protein
MNRRPVGGEGDTFSRSQFGPTGWRNGSVRIVEDFQQATLTGKMGAVPTSRLAQIATN